MNNTTEKKNHMDLIDFRPMTEKDLEFMYQVFSDTRFDELGLNEWSEEETENFLRIQFELQHKQYMEHYKGGRFDVILFNKKPVGRLYVHTNKQDIRIVDIALLKEFRRQGIGSKIMRDLIEESETKQLPLSLHVEINNPALGLYEQLGFEKGESTGVYYFMERPVAGKK